MLSDVFRKHEVVCAYISAQVNKQWRTADVFGICQLTGTDIHTHIHTPPAYGLQHARLFTLAQAPRILPQRQRRSVTRTYNHQHRIAYPCHRKVDNFLSFQISLEFKIRTLVFPQAHLHTSA